MFEVRDKDHAYAEYIGAVVIPTHTLLQGAVKEGWFPIMKKNKLSQRGTLNLRVQFISQVGYLHFSLSVQKCLVFREIK
jgi:hypothetical protein